MADRLGRSAVFASDAKSRWAEKWVTWNGFDRFWVNLFRDLLPHAQPGEATTSYDPASGNLVVDYKMAPQAGDPGKRRTSLFSGRTITSSRCRSARSRKGNIAARACRLTQGLFRIRPVEDSRFFPETGFYRPEEELTQYGSNEALLKQVSSFTGGRFSPKPAQVFDHRAGRTLRSMQLWPGLLALGHRAKRCRAGASQVAGYRFRFTRRPANVDA